MKLFRKTTLNVFFTGMLGFLLASLVGIFGTYLVVKLNLFRPLLNSIPEEQPLIRLYAGIVFAFLGVGIGGGINGLLRGYTLHSIRLAGQPAPLLAGRRFCLRHQWRCFADPGALNPDPSLAI